MCALDFESLLNHFCPTDYCCYEAWDSDIFFYEINSESFKAMVDSLRAMTDEQFKASFSFEDEEWLDYKDDLVDELQTMYDNRDMTWADGDSMWLTWF